MKMLTNRRGSVTLVSMIALSLFLAGGLALLENQNALLKDSAGNGNLEQAKFLAQGAYQEAHYYITHLDPAYQGTSPEQAVLVDGKSYGSYDYTVAKSGNSYSVTANGYVPGKNSPKRVVQTVSTTFTFTYVGVGLVVLDSAASGALSDSGNGNMTIYGGKVYVNSSSATGTSVSGNGKLIASEFDLAGGYSTSANGSIQGTIKTDQAPMGDPLANLAEPPIGSLPVQFATKQNISNTRTLNPGVYTGGIALSGNSNVTLNPGIYYINGGGLSVSGNGVLTGNNVMIFNAGTGASDVLSIAGNGNITVTAPASGTYQGISFFQQRASSNSVTFSGNARVRISGTLYFPSAALNLSGNSQVPNVGSLEVVKRLAVTGNGNLSINNY